MAAKCMLTNDCHHTHVCARATCVVARARARAHACACACANIVSFSKFVSISIITVVPVLLTLIHSSKYQNTADTNSLLKASNTATGLMYVMHVNRPHLRGDFAADGSTSSITSEKYW